MAARERSREAHGHQGSKIVNVQHHQTDGAGKKHISEIKRDVDRVTVNDLQEIRHAARVRVGSGVTLNTGQYESIRVDVSIEMPCAPSQKDVDRTYNKCSKWIEETLKDEIAIANEAGYFVK